MIKAKNLVKEYKDFRLDVSFEIPAGCITGFIGKNGAGKSTTIKLLLGLIKPTSGSIEVFDVDSFKMNDDAKQKLGVTLADSSFANSMNVKQINNILKLMYKEYDEEFFMSKCKEFGLPMDKKIEDFSTGMKAKVRVLIALSHKAKLLVMDEPTSGLDVEARKEILDLLRDYMAEDEERSIIITSHISTDLEGLCDDVYLIDDGKILIHEETDVILSSYGTLKVSDSQYEKIDKNYFVTVKKESFGYVCLTNQKQYYLENYPDVVIENASIDDLILNLAGGNRV